MDGAAVDSVAAAARLALALLASLQQPGDCLRADASPINASAAVATSTPSVTMPTHAIAFHEYLQGGETTGAQ